jgi:methylsterol monooxygenase
MCTIGVYYVYAGLLLEWLDKHHEPVAIYRRKLQPSVRYDELTGNQREMMLYVHANLWGVLMPSVVALCLVLYILEGYSLASLTRWDAAPSLAVATLQLAGLALVSEFAFYAAHRMLHTRYLFKHVHWIHHRESAPVAMAALYAHPAEALFGNVLPLGLGVLLLRPHLVVCCIWFVLATVGTCSEHSGYALPWWPAGRTRAHDEHHRLRQGHFAFLGLADGLFGTNHGGLEIRPADQRASD